MPPKVEALFTAPKVAVDERVELRTDVVGALAMAQGERPPGLIMITTTNDNNKAIQTNHNDQQ